jgi:hypothetical protein
LSSRKSLGGSKLLPFKKDGGHFVLGELQCCIHFCWYPSLDLCLNTILSLSSTDNSFNLMAWFLLWPAQSSVGPYIDMCVHFQSIEFTIGGLQDVETSRMINGKDARELNFESHSKGSEYLCK